MSAPLIQKEILEPPHPSDYKNQKQYNWDYTIWNRTGGYKSTLPSLSGLEASSTELNTLVGIDTSTSVQKQLNLKANISNLGTMAYQNKTAVDISGGAVSSVAISSSTIASTDITMQAGTSATTYVPCGTIHVDLGSYANVLAGETTLATYTLLANTLNNDEECIEVTAFGSFTANGNNKQLKLKLGSTTLYDTTSLALNSGSWVINAKIIRSSVAVERCAVTMLTSNLTGLVNSGHYVLALEDLSTDLVLKCTGQGAASSDISQDGFYIKYFKM